MSERKLREIVKEYVHSCAALDAVPDVVKVLWAIEKLKVNSECPLTLAYLAKQIEEGFGVRLTDDGYEWTEEATDGQV